MPSAAPSARDVTRQCPTLSLGHAVQALLNVTKLSLSVMKDGRPSMHKSHSRPVLWAGPALDMDKGVE
ncbi:hypothetical protein GCM10027290_06000 [Micromonospora sonneratiae]